MTFTDAFTDTNGVLLQNHGTGWTKICGDDFDIQSNALRRNAATSATYTAYLRPSDGSADQIAIADIAATSAGPIVLTSGTSAADFCGYILRRTSGTSVRINKIINGVIQTTNYALVTVANTLGIGLRATVSGSTVTFDVVRWNGSSYTSLGVGTGTGSDGTSAFTSGTRGLAHAAATTMTSGGLDAYQDNYSAVVAIPRTSGLSLGLRLGL